MITFLIRAAIFVFSAALGLIVADLILPGFHIDGFWTALLGALVVGLTGWIGSWFIGGKGMERMRRD